MSSQRILKHYHRLAQLWPKDLLRPNLPFTSALEYRASLFTPNPQAQTNTQSPSSPAPTSKTPSSSTTTTPSSKSSTPDAQAELLNINALYSLLENRYSKRYPTAPALLRPQSKPAYYEELMAEIERAPNKSWLRAKLDEWKMKVRWQ